MHQIQFPQTPLGAYSDPPDTLAGFKVAASRQGGGTGRDGEREGRGMGKEVKRRGEKGEKGKGWRREGGKVTEGMGGTGQDMG